jgi:hypothetical protein
VQRRFMMDCFKYGTGGDVVQMDVSSETAEGVQGTPSKGPAVAPRSNQTAVISNLPARHAYSVKRKRKSSPKPRKVRGEAQSGASGGSHGDIATHVSLSEEEVQ